MIHDTIHSRTAGVSTLVAGSRSASVHRGRWLTLALLLGVVSTQLLLLWLQGCDDESPTGSPGPPDEGIVIGDTVTTELFLPAGAQYADSVTGLAFFFPEGAGGRLTRGDLRSGPERPWDGGAGFYIAYTGTEPVQIQIPHEERDCSVLLGYGTPRGAWTGGMRARWFALPVADTVRGGAGDSIRVWLSARLPEDDVICEAATAYWLLESPAGSATADSFQTVISLARQYIAAWLDSLDEETRATCTARMELELPPAFYPDGNYYSGFVRACPPDGGPIAQARIGLRPSATAGAIAHQVGHYVTHVLVGDGAFLFLEQGNAGNGGVGTLRGPTRPGQIEDYAYFHEWLLTGAIEGAGDPANPAEFFTPRIPRPDPATIDVPSLEGYGTLLLHGLTRHDSLRVSITGETVTVLVIGLDYAEIAAHVLAGGPATANTLWLAIEAYLQTLGMAERLPLLAAATGWTYYGLGQVIGRDEHPVANAQIWNLTRIAGREYFSSASPALSNGAGKFTILGLIPGASLLRVGTPGDTFEVPLSVVGTFGTIYPRSLGSIVAWANLDRLERLRIRLNLRFAPGGVDSLPYLAVNFIGRLEDTTAVFAERSIYLEEPRDFACADTLPPAQCWTAESLRIDYDLTTGQVSQLVVQLHNLDPAQTSLTLRARGRLQAVMEGSARVYFARLISAPADMVREQFAIELSGPAGEHYTERDLVSVNTQATIEILAYCG